MSANSRKRLRQSYLTTPSQQIARGGFSFFVWGLSLLIIPFCIYFIGPLWGWSIGTVIWMEAFAQSFHLFVVSVPEVTGLITLNYFVRPTPIDPYTNLHVYPPGLSFKFPWEQVKEGLYINLRIVTLTFFEDFSTKSSPSKVTVRQTEKDGSFTHKTKTLRSKAGAGPKVTVRGEVQYRAILELLPRYIAVAEESILEGLLNIIRSDLAIEVAQTLPEKVRSEIKEAQKRLTELFRDPDQLIRAAREIQMAEQLAPGEVKEVTFILGQGANRKQALRLARQYQSIAKVEEAWEALTEHWEDLLNRVTVKTPDPAMDLLLNRWLLYQSLSCRV